jgi:branched-chain amino acid transport system ATP-binding protein
VNALRLERVQVRYGRTHVIRDVDLTVPAGSVVALLGPNGAGKTTLLKAIAGLLPVSGGVVRLFGEEATNQSGFRRSRAGLRLVPEGRGIFRDLTVEENLRMFAADGDVQRAQDVAIAMFPKLGTRLRQIAGTMSGGEQQMLALSGALISEASMILADELSMGLAPVIVDEIYEAVAELRGQGRSVLLVEQYIERALGLADYVYLLQKGRIAAGGEASQFADGSLFERYLGQTA